MCLQHKDDLIDRLGNKLQKFDFVDHIEDRCDYFEVNDDQKLVLPYKGSNHYAIEHTWTNWEAE